MIDVASQIDKSLALLISFDVRRFSDRPRSERGYVTHFMIDDEYIKLRSKNMERPNVAEQVKNIITFIGDELNQTGEPMRGMPDNLYLKIGAQNPTFAGAILKELHFSGYIIGNPIEALGQPFDIGYANLSLGGWERYEAEKRGKFAGNYGFIAYDFKETTIIDLINNHIRPFVKEELNYEIRDMVVVARAGIIDNIMRQQIRDSAFVIADLTHGNKGAYWEAGYAEGLGKPVIYICEKTAFDGGVSHFDTKHCTTVMWSGEDEGHMNFKQSLVATIRRSLNLFN